VFKISVTFWGGRENFNIRIVALTDPEMKFNENGWEAEKGVSMSRKYAFAGIAVLLMSLWSCEDIGVTNLLDETRPPDNELVWVGKVFSGGRQCTTDMYAPPDTKRLLNQEGIAVFSTLVEPYAVCNACTICPTYSALHAARIRKTQLAQAEELGFRVVEILPIALLHGKWRWRVSVGGIAGHTLTPPPSIRLEYDRSGLFSYYRNDTLVATTSFVVRREPTLLSADSSDVIHYRDSVRFVPQAFRCDNDTLKLSDLCIDCYNHEYLKVP
jgi:hypothetical protein